VRRSPRNLRIACNHAGLTHFGGVYFFHEFLRQLQLRDFLARRLAYIRHRSRYTVPLMILALIYPIVLGLDRIETASFLRSNGTFQYLTGLPAFPDPQTLRRFLLHAPTRFWKQLHRINDRLLQHFIHLPQHRSRLVFDVDSTVITVFGHQDGAEVGYNPRYRGKRSYNPLLCMEAKSSYLWEAELRRGNAGTWDGSVELLDACFAKVPPDVRELRVRADAGFGFNPVFDALESRPAQYAVVARMVPALQRLLPGLRYTPVGSDWEMAEFEYRPHTWSRPRRFVVARQFLAPAEKQPTLFALGRYVYRAWVTNVSLTPLGVWHFYDARAALEPRIRELLEDYALRRIPTRSFEANALFLEIIRLAYNLVTAFQRLCLPELWQHLTLSKLRYKLFMLPGELTRPQNRPILRLRESSLLQALADDILRSISKVRPLIS
jgi:hypothetical protein